jgi:hypothetical protein
MKRLSVRQKGAKVDGLGFYVVGPAGNGPTATTFARNKREALREGKKKLCDSFQLQEAIAKTFRRDANGVDTSKPGHIAVPRGNKH